MRTTLALALALGGCQTRVNLKYCDSGTPCAVGSCDYVKHECGVPVDMAMGDLAAETLDLEQAIDPDLSEEPDLLLPDLAPPPDLTPLPDLAPPPVYFDPQVQAILNAGGCAKAGCHNASDGLYTPFLIPSPTTATAMHANYLSFVAESQTTVIQKLVKSDGIAHGGTMTSADRKPCSSDIDEPCVTLARWYATGAPEGP